MTGELAAFSLACGLGFATVCYQSNDQRVCRGRGFELVTDASSTVLQPGTTEVIEIIIDREADFDPTLRLQVAAPRGIRASLSSKRLSRDHDGRVQLTISADADVCRGWRIITVVAYSDIRQVASIPIRFWVGGDTE